MNRAVYQSIVSKIGTVMPLFGKALVDMALKRHGHTAETISPVEMLELIKSEINPRLANRLQTVTTVLNAGAGVAQLDAEDRVVYANAVVRRMAGAGDFALPSAAVFAILRDYGFVRSAREVSSLEIQDFYSERLGKDFSIMLCPIRDGERCHGLISIIQDVTVREAIDAEIIRFHESLRHLNESLRREVSDRQRAEADLRNVVQCIADAILVVDRNGLVVRVNPAALHLCAASERELLGKPVEDLLEPSTALEGGLMGHLLAGGALSDLDATLVRAGQKPIPILLSGSMWRDEVAGVMGAVYSAKDMRQRHALIAKLVTTSKLAALGEMAGGIAHEINTPLTVIQGRAGQIRRMLEEGVGDPTTLATFAGRIEATVKRIARIVHGLRSFARQADQDPIESVPVAGIVAEALDLCRERFRSHGVALRHESIDDSLRVSCRPTQISQVLLNLLSNAFDAVENTPEKWVALTVGLQDDHVELSVEDSGPGVPPDQRELIFQPFFTTKPVGQGTGLGLSISLGILQEQGGTLFLDEHSPHTRFVVSLPQSSAHLSSPAATT